MTTSYLALAALLTAAAPAEPVLLTPETLAKHGFHWKCYVVYNLEKIASVREDPPLRPKGSMLVR